MSLRLEKFIGIGTAADIVRIWVAAESFWFLPHDADDTDVLRFIFDTALGSVRITVTLRTIHKSVRRPVRRALSEVRGQTHVSFVAW